MVQNAMRETGLSAGDTVLIGDSIYDMQMAKAAGVRAIGVAWGYHPPDDLIDAGADAIVEDFAALDRTLAALWSVDA
jgi:phosphoglycolate phosphatase